MTHKHKAFLLLMSTVALVFAGTATASAQVGHEIDTGGSNEDLCDVNASGDASEQSGDVCSNYGDNDGSVDQRGRASSGDAVAGQVVGVVSAGDASVDATNRTEDADVETGDASGTNEAHLDVGHDIAFQAGGGGENNDLCVTEAEGGLATNSGDSCVNDGDNDGSIDQLADATSGDGVAGQVVGAVTSAGGAADLVLANESEDVNVDTGDATFDNFSDAFVGHSIVFDVSFVGETEDEEEGGAGPCQTPGAVVVTLATVLPFTGALPPPGTIVIAPIVEGGQACGLIGGSVDPFEGLPGVIFPMCFPDFPQLVNGGTACAQIVP